MGLTTNNTSTPWNSETYIDRRFIKAENIELASSFNMVCLRNVATNRLEAIGWSENSLQYAVDKLGKSLYFNPTTTKINPVVWTDGDGKSFVIFGHGKKDRNKFYKVEAYVPLNHIDSLGKPIATDYKLAKQALSFQSAELTFLDKAVRLGLFKSQYDKLDIIS